MTGIDIYRNHEIEELKDSLQKLSKEAGKWSWFGKTIDEALSKGWEPSPLEEMLENWVDFKALYKEMLEENGEDVNWTLEDNIHLVFGGYALAAYDFLYEREWPISLWNVD